MNNALSTFPMTTNLTPPSLSGAWIEVLLWSRHVQTLDVRDVGRTLTAFLEEDVTTIAWSDQMVVALLPLSVGDDEFGDALQEVILSELGYEVDIAMAEITEVSVDFVRVANTLMRTIALGRQFEPNRYVHAEQQLEMERILGAMDRAYAIQYVTEMQARFSDVDDEEMWATIEAFLTSNQNVSETAKRLYVHRNTLIYRLDRFKMATGFDVRIFEDAMVVKMYRKMAIAVRNLY